MAVNYEELLRKYIKHVDGCEGEDFIANYFRCDGDFTDEEWDALRKLAGYSP